ncbi:gluconate 2-dehydrogenase subunit 3 family protein [Sphingomonas sp. DT-51]|uniref:gluconate 2-dehydrogenase subunit 3 family protein n=1 Tax=Sphingomonas sp. DT-51 TaxID=3396165 RepID=UPI003F1D3E17
MTLSRRTTLQWIAAAAALPLTHWTDAAGATKARGTPPPFRVIDWPATLPPVDAARGYGRDPNLSDPNVPWALTLTKAQRATVDLLGDLLLPPDESSPGAGKLGVGAFIDEWISAPYPVQQADRAEVVGGLIWLDAQSRALYEQPFAALAAAPRASLLDALTVAAPSPAMAAPVAFMDRLRYLFVLGFYSLPEGKADMRFVGDQPTEGPYPGPSAEAMTHLTTVLAELRLPRSERLG